MTNRRQALVIGSQCAALDALSFLPTQPGPLDLAALSAPQRPLVGLRDLLVDGPGECTPVEVTGQFGPGPLNPTKSMF